MTIYAEYEIPQVEGHGADARSRRKRQANGPGRAISKPSLPACIHFATYEIIPCLA